MRTGEHVLEWLLLITHSTSLGGSVRVRGNLPQVKIFESYISCRPSCVVYPRWRRTPHPSPPGPGPPSPLLSGRGKNWSGGQLCTSGLYTRSDSTRIRCSTSDTVHTRHSSAVTAPVWYCLFEFFLAILWTCFTFVMMRSSLFMFNCASAPTPCFYWGQVSVGSPLSERTELRFYTAVWRREGLRRNWFVIPSKAPSKGMMFYFLCTYTDLRLISKCCEAFGIAATRPAILFRIRDCLL